MQTNASGDTRPAGKSRLETLAFGAIAILGYGAVGMLLYLARAAFVPVAFSLLFALVLSSPVEFLRRCGVPRSIGASLILLVVTGVAGATVGAIWAPAHAWAAAAPDAIRVVEHRLGPIARVLERVVVGTNPDDTPRSASRASAADAFAVSASGALIGDAPAIATNVTTIVILTTFLLVGGAPMTARVAATLTSEGKSVKVLKVIETMRSEVARYYATLAMINLGLGAATGTATALLGLPSPLLWGTMAAVLNFIPYVGSAVTLAVLTLVSFVTFDSLGHVLAVAGSFLALVTIEGQIVEPLLIGRRLKLSPIVVFLALWFGGWFWGIAGIILAIPTLVALKVAAEHSRNGRILVELLSPTPHKYRITPGKPDVPRPVDGTPDGSP
jgi:predicted PurR-regulated permease PerM